MATNKNLTWETIPFDGYGGGNSILQLKNFRISYQPRGGDFSPATGTTEETALCKGSCFYILNGDFRTEYEAIGNDWEKAKAFFDKSVKENPGLLSVWSN